MRATCIRRGRQILRARDSRIEARRRSASGRGQRKMRHLSRRTSGRALRLNSDDYSAAFHRSIPPPPYKAKLTAVQASRPTNQKNRPPRRRPSRQRPSRPPAASFSRRQNVVGAPIFIVAIARHVASSPVPRRFGDAEAGINFPRKKLPTLRVKRRRFFTSNYCARAADESSHDECLRTKFECEPKASEINCTSYVTRSQSSQLALFIILHRTCVEIQIK